MYLVLDKRAPWRYTRGPFVFLDGLKSRLTQRYSSISSPPDCAILWRVFTAKSNVPLPAVAVAAALIFFIMSPRSLVMRGVIHSWLSAQIPQVLIDGFL
jgi:hypothetical protein